MSENDLSPSENYWHDRYFKLLSEFETLAQDNKDKYEQLRQGLVMTSLLAEGQTLSLDRPLRELRNALKPGSDQLPTALVTLRQSIDQFDEESAVHFEVLIGLIADSAHKLSLCPLPKPLLLQIKTIRQNASNELERWDGYRQQLQAWLEVIGEIASTTDETTQTSSWWQSWFSPLKAQDDSTQDELPESIHSNKEADVLELVQNVSVTVHSLLDKLIIPDHLAASKLNILERLELPLAWHELAPVLDDTANFLFQCIEASQLRIEQFLQSLDARLQDIRSLVTKADASSNEHSNVGSELDILIRKQLANVHSVITDDSDLRSLTAKVPEHLELIRQALERKRVQEDERQRQLKAHTLKLQKRLNEMEAELDRSKQTLEAKNRMVTLDPLTGLPKREAFHRRISEEIARAKRLNSPLSLVCCDVDSFERINDEFGYLSGNKALQLIARILRTNTRETDFIVRFAGEKFIILMPDTTAEKAKEVAEQLCHLIEKSPFSYLKKRVLITMSTGIAEFSGTETATSTFERAQAALKQAKQMGGNTTVLAAL